MAISTIEYDPRHVYQERTERFRRERDALDERWNRIGNVRLLTFLVAVVALIWGFWGNIVTLWAMGLLLIVGFFVLVWHHNRVGMARRRAGELYRINNEAIMRLEKRWDELPLRHNVEVRPGDPYAHDLGIFGHASLFQLLDTAGTFTGERTLARWLASHAPPEEVGERQEAVRELAPMLDLRDELYLRGRLMSMNDDKPDPAPFLRWATAAPWLAERRWLPPLSYVSVALFWALALAHAFGAIAYPLWFLVAAANFLFSLSEGRKIYGIIEQVDAGERGFKQYGEAFHLLSSARLEAARLRGLQAKLASGGTPAHEAIRRLQRLVNFTVPPSAQLYYVVQAITLWDVHLLRALERWQGKYGRHAPAWLDTLGEAEALSSLASLHHANPAWVFPTVDRSVDRLDAVGLGHPLLPDDVRVVNDVEVGPPGTFLMVTGSNMSGKSTLLRAIGTNVVLAQAGGPVCAASMSMPPVQLWTAMRVEDSLLRGVSYFMAELQRLKQVVEAARQAHEKGEARLFYLLDEILQGTNTAERQIAARRVIRYLVEMGAIGAVSTHDLTLADSPELAEAARLVHFTEQVQGGNGHAAPQMHFDYKLRPGIATSTNALKLMDIVFGR
ncbi:MAG: DNA mismatch repair protein MutS [Chloroflexia bacterium]